jgi:hypothetical protein
VKTEQYLQNLGPYSPSPDIRIQEFQKVVDRAAHEVVAA